MATLQIRNFGPIKDTGNLEITSFLLIIGRQSSGKSTFMKVLSYCRWVEKRIMLYSKDECIFFSNNKRFTSRLKEFHRIDESYFCESTSIQYDGDCISISYSGIDNDAIIKMKTEIEGHSYNTKICYIPSERNLVSAIRNIDKAYKSSEQDSLFNFIYEWDEARSEYSKEKPFPLSVTGGFKYMSLSGDDIIIRPDGTPTQAYYASSGIQSAMPVDIMVDYITHLVGRTASFSKHDLAKSVMEYVNMVNNQNELDDITLKKVIRKLNYQSSQLFIEEPEQNLYPESQRMLMLSLISALNRSISKGSEQSLMAITTHSPYIVSTMNVLIRISEALAERPDDDRIKGIIEPQYLLPLHKASAYFINAEGMFEDILDREVPMFVGNELDGVSDWVDDKIATLNKILYGDE